MLFNVCINGPFFTACISQSTHLQFCLCCSIHPRLLPTWTYAQRINQNLAEQRRCLPNGYNRDFGQYQLRRGAKISKFSLKSEPSAAPCKCKSHLLDALSRRYQAAFVSLAHLIRLKERVS